MKAIVLGATGAVGSALVRELLGSTRFTEVRALSRRAFTGLHDAPGAEKLRVQVIDFRNLEDAALRLSAGCEVAFCTLGIGQPRKVSTQEFWNVDVEYAGAFARGGRNAGVRHISLLSSVGTNRESWNRYLRIKGAAEDAVTSAGIWRTSIFRPSLLVTREIRYGLQDRVTQAVFPLVAPFLPQALRQIRVEDLGRAMRINAERAGRPGVEILHYPEFAELLASRDALRVD